MSKKSWILGILILFIFICYAIFEWFMPYSGDDLAYIGSTIEYVNQRSVWHMPLKWAGHWLGSNGRFANMIFLSMGPAFPHWLMALLNATFITMMIIFIVKLCGFKGKDVTGKTLIISIITFAFCWWDSMQVYDCIYNYILSTVLGLAFIKTLLDNKPIKTKWGTIGLAILAFVAGGMHEAMSVSLLCGIIAYAFFNRSFYSSLTRSHQVALNAFVCGVAIVFFAPGIWFRFGRSITPDDPLHILLLKSDFIALAFFVAIGVGLCVASCRKKIIEAVHSPWIVFVVATTVAMCFSAVSGVVGRSGWFAQVFALIAIAKWVNDHDYKINRIAGGVVSSLLIAAIVFHVVEITRWQVKVGKEVETVAQMYSESKDGQVYFDATRDNELPWWTLNKTRGVPDADDLYLISTFSQFYGTNGYPLVLLPTEILEIDFKHFSKSENEMGMLQLSNGDKITTKDIVVHQFESDREDLSVYVWIDENNVEWVVNDFDFNGISLSHLTPRIIDPGDRLSYQMEIACD